MNTTYEPRIGKAEKAGGDLRNTLTDAWQSAIDASDAQFEIWMLKASRVVLATCFGLLGMGALAALGIYGFTLLDAAFFIWLSQPGWPAWLAPLVRGVLYFGLPMILFAMGWHTGVGYGSDPERD